MIRAALLFVVMLALSACTVFQLGERYDKSIDDDLNAFQTETVSFITSMRLNAGSPAGTYTSEAARAFYPKATAALANIDLRAGQLSSRECPINAIASKITLPLDDIVGETSETAQPPGRISGNCMEVTLLSIQKQLRDLETGHRDHKQIGAVRAQWHIDGINDSVAIALSGLRAKDY